jgi:hypothetical protein
VNVAHGQAKFSSPKHRGAGVSARAYVPLPVPANKSQCLRDRVRAIDRTDLGALTIIAARHLLRQWDAPCGVLFALHNGLGAINAPTKHNPIAIPIQTLTCRGTSWGQTGSCNFWSHTM